MKNLPTIFGAPRESPQVESVQPVSDIREQMRDFKKRWETQLDLNYAQMSQEALALGFKIESNYGGSHSSFGGEMGRSRIELKVML